MNRHRYCFVRLTWTFAAMAVAAALSGAATAVQPVCNTSSGFCADAHFLAYYRANQGDYFLGAPESWLVRRGNILVQYFQKGTLEYNLVTGHIRKGDAGLALVRHRLPFAPAESVPDNPAHLNFPETGHHISWAFKDFYLANDGFRQFGPPISPELEDDVLWAKKTQYFTKARLEFRPELTGTPNMVQMGNVGFDLLQAEDRAAQQPRPAPLRYGMQVHAWRAHDHREILRFVGEAGFGWAKHLVQWSQIETAPAEYDWFELDAIVKAAELYGLKVLITIVEAPAWARSAPGPGRPDDLANFERFMAVLAERYKGRIAAYEIWNEPNLARFWGEKISPVEYVQLLQAGSAGVRRADPNALVLFAGLAQNGAGNPALGVDDVDFLRSAYKYQGGVVREYFDILGNHSYGYRSPPHAEYDAWFGDANGPYFAHPSFFFKRFVQIRGVMEEYADAAKPIWMTEFGWTTDNQHKDFPFGQYITEAQQAKYVVDAFEMVERQYPYVQAMFLFNLNFRTLGLPDTSEDGFSLLDIGFAPRPVYIAVTAMDKTKVSQSRAP